MQTMTAQIQIFHSLRGKWEKVNLFSNRVNFFSTPYHRITVTFSGFRIGENNHINFILYI